MEIAGRREFIQVLRLMEDFHQHQVERAVSEALPLGAISFDAHDAALRPPPRRDEPRRGGKSDDLSTAHR